MPSPESLSYAHKAMVEAATRSTQSSIKSVESSAEMMMARNSRKRLSWLRERFSAEFRAQRDAETSYLELHLKQEVTRTDRLGHRLMDIELASELILVNHRRRKGMPQEATIKGRLAGVDIEIKGRPAYWRIDKDRIIGGSIGGKDIGECGGLAARIFDEYLGVLQERYNLARNMDSQGRSTRAGI